MVKLGVTSTSTVSEPRAATSTTTVFTRFPDGAAFAAYEHDACSRRGCWYLYVEFVKEANRKKKCQCHCLVMQLHFMDLELTFTGLHAIRPAVINMFAAKSSTFLEPSTARSATTDSG